MVFSVRVKLLAGFVTVLALMGLVGAVNLYNLNAVGGQATSMYGERLLPGQDLAEANTQMHRMRSNLLVHLLSEDPKKMTDTEVEIAKHEKWMLERIDRYSKTRLTPEEQEWLAKLSAAWPAYKALIDNSLKLNREGKRAEAAAILKGPEKEKRTPMQEALDKLIELNVSLAAQSDQHNRQAFESSRNTVLLALLLATLLGLGLATLLARSIARRVALVAAAAAEVAEGNIQVELKATGRDEIDRLAHSFNRVVLYLKEMAQVADSVSRGDLSLRVEPRSSGDYLGAALQRMVGNLSGLVSGITQSASAVALSSRQLTGASSQAGAATQQIATSIQQVAAGAQEQSATAQRTNTSARRWTRALDEIATGAQEQARSVERVSAAVVQLNRSISQAASASRVLSSMGEQVAAAAGAGTAAVLKTTRGMEAIKAGSDEAAARVRELGRHSEQIGAIVEAIDEIAAQTNLLALNAAIEAARAGEHGRGFAVVADEVRKLAERSSRETRQIAELIARVQEGTRGAVEAMDLGAGEVRAGTDLAEETSSALKNIFDAIRVTNEQVGQIAAAIGEMEDASKEVVTLMDSVSAVVEQSTLAGQQLASASEEMTSAIERIVAVSEQSSAAAQEVGASTEEMGAQVQEVIGQAHSLAETAEGLQAAVWEFSLGEQPEGASLRQEDWERIDPSRGEPLIREARLLAVR